ncbi:MAG: CAP domain-containing protein [Candidatus Colwellbacteria bacterium]
MAINIDILINMKIWTKNYFIPHEGNDHKPHALRVKGIIFMLALALVTELAFMAHVSLIRNTGYLAEIISSVLVEQTNDERVTLGITELKVNPILQQAARLKAYDMATKSYFAHISPEGVEPWAWLEAAGYTFAAAGENLAVNFTDSDDVTEAWMDSPGHKANIVNQNFTEIGIATAKGKYKGEDAIFVVQFFGKPVVQTASAVVAPQVATSATPKPAPETIKEVKDTYIELEESVAVVEQEQVIEEESAPKAAPVDEQSFALVRTTPIERAASNPRGIYNLMLLTIATIVGLALALKVFVRMDIQHPPLIINGVLLLLIVASALVFNNYLSLSQAIIV